MWLYKDKEIENPKVETPPPPPTQIFLETNLYPIIHHKTSMAREILENISNNLPRLTMCPPN